MKRNGIEWKTKREKFFAKIRFISSFGACVCAMDIFIHKLYSLAHHKNRYERIHISMWQMCYAHSRKTFNPSKKKFFFWKPYKMQFIFISLFSLSLCCVCMYNLMCHRIIDAWPAVVYPLLQYYYDDFDNFFLLSSLLFYFFSFFFHFDSCHNKIIWKRGEK